MHGLRTNFFIGTISFVITSLIVSNRTAVSICNLDWSYLLHLSICIFDLILLHVVALFFVLVRSQLLIYIGLMTSVVTGNIMTPKIIIASIINVICCFRYCVSLPHHLSIKRDSLT